MKISHFEKNLNLTLFTSVTRIGAQTPMPKFQVIDKRLFCSLESNLPLPVPKMKQIITLDGNDFQDFLDWLEINHDFNKPLGEGQSDILLLIILHLILFL